MLSGFELYPRWVPLILHEFYIKVINCSLKFLSESSQLCEVNVIGKNVWFIQPDSSSFTIFTQLEALLDNFKSNFF